MPQFKLVNGAFIDGKVLNSGDVVELTEEQAEGYLGRGTVVPFQGGDEKADEPAPTTPVDEGTPVVPPVDSVPQAPVDPPVVGSDTTLTPEQVDADFQQAGVTTSPNVPPQV